VRHGPGYSSDDGDAAKVRWRISAGDEDFLTQTLQVHFVELPRKVAIRAMGIRTRRRSTFFMGLWQQGRGGPIERPDEFGERADWSGIWTPGVQQRKKVVSSADTAGKRDR
jgi:hypothetical protein